MRAAELVSIDRDWLTVNQVASVLGCDPDTIRGQARTHPELLGFPVSVTGKMTKIPKIPFLKFMGVIQ